MAPAAPILERHSSEQRAFGDSWNGALHGATRCLCCLPRDGPADIRSSKQMRCDLPAFIPIHVTFLPPHLCSSFFSCPPFVLSATASLNFNTLAIAITWELSCTTSHWQFVLQRAHHKLANILHLDSLPAHCNEWLGVGSWCWLDNNLISAESVMSKGVWEGFGVVFAAVWVYHIQSSTTHVGRHFTKATTRGTM